MEEDRFTIKLTGKESAIPAASFLIVMQNMLQILRDVNMAMAEDHKANLKWSFSHVSMNSPLTANMFPTAISGRDIGKPVAIAGAEGLRQIEQQGDVVPRYFQLRTLKRAKNIVGVLRDGVGEIEIDTAYTRPITLTSRLAVNVNIVSKDSYTDYGTFEGLLETASVRDSTRLTIYDPIYGHIPCYFKDSMTEDVRRYWTSRVSVFGLTSYTRSGTPRSIQVERIVKLRDQRELPQWEDLKGMKLSLVDMEDYSRGVTDAN